MRPNIGAAVRHEPLLVGTLAALAEETIERITRALVQAGPSGDHTLGAGNLGIALFLEYEGQRRGEPRCSAPFVEPVLAALATERLGGSLFAGLSGVAWAIHHLERSQSDELTDLGELHAALRAHAESSGTGRVVDLMSGQIGVGVSCLEHLPDAAARECLELIVQRIEESVDLAADAPWLMLAKPLVVPARADLGMSHGVPGLIALLARTYREGIRREASHRLLRHAVPWLLKQRQTRGSRFPYCEGGAEPARDAWCYGDPSVALALFAAGRALQQGAWGGVARQQALLAARRSPGTSGVRDAGFCHGSSGLGHMFHRFFRATGDAELHAAATGWFVRTLDFPSVHPGGIAGYSAVRGNVGGGQTWEPDTGLLTGIAGIGLALLSAVADRALPWDRPFLTDVA